MPYNPRLGLSRSILFLKVLDESRLFVSFSHLVNTSIAQNTKLVKGSVALFLKIGLF